MLILKQNPTQIVLEIAAVNADGSSKTDVVSASVRVYHWASGVQVNDLSSTPLVRIGVTNIWDYIWAPTSLTEGYYIAEYTITDSGALTTVVGEDIIVGYLENDISIIKEVETGKWDMVANQLILYKSDNVTEIARFNLFGLDGLPTMDAVTKRVRL